MALPVQTNPYIIEHLDFKEQEKTINLASHLLEVEAVYSALNRSRSARPPPAPSSSQPSTR